ncbi:MAG: peroxiredoxin [Longimicrobiales bacterium]
MKQRPEKNASAPDFTLPDGRNKPIKLSQFQGKNLVLAFYPADWSPVCTSELALVQEVLDEIHGHNAEFVGISVDSPWSHRAWADRQHLTFPLLSDFWPHGAVSSKYGVFRDREGTSDRALFFIDSTGRIRDSWVAEDPWIAPGLDVIFGPLEEMQQSLRAPTKMTNAEQTRPAVNREDGKRQGARNG